MKRTFSTLPSKDAGKVAVYEHNAFYPNGKFVWKHRSQNHADLWIARQVAEDKDTRAAKVADYLAARAARAPIVAEVSNQLNLF